MPCTCPRLTISPSGANGRGGLIQCDVPPDRVSVGLNREGRAICLPRGRPAVTSALPAPPADAPAVRASQRFLTLARSAALHSDPARFGLLYQVLVAASAQIRA